MMFAPIATRPPEPMSSPLLSQFSFFFLFILLSVSSLNAKFYFNFHSNSLQLPTCTLSGVKTVHLPSTYSSANTQIRLHFPSPSTTHPAPLNFEAFSSSSQRIFRLELAFLHDHVQINWNGLISSWHGINRESENYLEIKLTSTPVFKLNGRTVSVLVPEPVTRSTAFKLIYDESAAPDADWHDLLNDPEIIDSLQSSPPTWQQPLISAESLVNEPRDIDLALVDYIVYDCQSFTQLQISSGLPLPKVHKKAKASRLNRNFKLLNFFRSSAQLPVVHGTNKKRTTNTRILGTLVISAFIVYLAVLLHLSKMTSIRPSINNKKYVSDPTKQQQQQSKSQLSHLSQSGSQSNSQSNSQSQLKLPTTVNPFKSPSRTILIDLPDAPLFKSSLSLSNSGSVLKVSVPAALSLADNRHILFPSKLRK